MEDKNDIGNTGILLIGGSAGSLKVLFELLPKLEVNLGFPIIVVVHRKAAPDSHLESVFKKHTQLKTFEIEDKMSLEANTIYLAPADYHVLVETPTELALDYSEKLHYSRPSIDVTFQSAVEIFGKKTVALLLSGANHDGVQGLKHVKAAGGMVLIQDPDTAEVDLMPREATVQVEADHIVKPEEMGNFINALANKTKNY
ncbi:chemotaxis protein CheB [Sphingobacterium sp. lm-10]|uniref:chemotaxis protein CheB n=1 Tax=Sphingobacterium sp. lm-10 TaxID=2944904 RepID=UPI00202251F3|nr:chemotaxis protein CheB [Sphingobacterium sp. lm-10]MCL7986964.1 chemotaxis protein CheB [Sphingobacterium sp. lm-10]